MNDTETISWIFLAIAFASEKEAASLNEISMIADGINHSIPTQKEMQLSIKWLLNNNLITKTNRKYSLTDKRLKTVNDSRMNEIATLNMWKKLDQLIQTI